MKKKKTIKNNNEQTNTQTNKRYVKYIYIEAQQRSDSQIQNFIAYGS